MIEFACYGCGRKFLAPDEFAGRRAKCNTCGAALEVPPRPSPQTSVRNRRLKADAEQIVASLAAAPLVRVVEALGEPPDRYRIEYLVKSIEKMKRNKPTFREQHLVEIQLTAEYPRVGPKCKMLTPIFHPNIDESSVCVGDHWTAGERLGDLIFRIGEMLAYQAYNIKSPLNGEAAMWADLHQEELPVDPRPVRPAEVDAV